MLKNGVHTATFLKYVWPSFNIINERVKTKICGTMYSKMNQVKFVEDCLLS